MRVTGFLRTLQAMVLGIAGALVGASEAQAIEITCLGKRTVTYDFSAQGTRDMSHIAISGEFVTGDFNKFQAAFATLTATPGGCFSRNHKYGASGDGYVIQLNSSGGSFVEAIRLASHVAENFIGTYVGPNAQCLSACALVFMAGKQHLVDGDKADGKRMHYTAQIGLHSPFLPASDLSGLPPEVLQEVLGTTYSEAIVAASELTVLAIRAGWEPGFVNLVLRTPPNQFMYIDTFGKVGDWNIQLEGLEAPPAKSVEELEIACINYIYWSKVDAGLALSESQNFDPGQMLAPLPEDYQRYAKQDELNVQRKPRKDDKPGETFSFVSEWDGEQCSFDIDPDGNIEGQQAWDRPFKNLHLIHSYVRLDSIPRPTSAQQTAAPQQPALAPGQITFAQAVEGRLWDHNGSVMRSFMHADGRFEIVYHQPRPGLLSIGVVSGTPLIVAAPAGQGLQATAWLFGRNGCPAVQYNVTAQLSDLAGTQLVLRGASPTRDAACNIIGYDSQSANATLAFRRLN